MGTLEMTTNTQLTILSLMYYREGKYVRPFPFSLLTVDGTNSAHCFSPPSRDAALNPSQKTFSPAEPQAPPQNRMRMYI